LEDCFSALQRAENSSTSRSSSSASSARTVSVLFSEPKIPQQTIQPLLRYFNAGFSALQRAENSSTLPRR